LPDFSEFCPIGGCLCKPRSSSSSLFFVLVLRTRSIDLVLPEVLLESCSVSLVFRPDFSEFCPIGGCLCKPRSSSSSLFFVLVLHPRTGRCPLDPYDLTAQVDPCDLTVQIDPHGEVISEAYVLEYGSDCLEMHVGAVQPEERVLVIDDLVATGGTLSAAIRLLEELGGGLWPLTQGQRHGQWTPSMISASVDLAVNAGSRVLVKPSLGSPKKPPNELSSGFLSEIHNKLRPERLASISLDARISVGVHVWTLTPAQRPVVDAKMAFGQKPERLASISLDARISVGVHVWMLTPAQRPVVDAKMAFGQNCEFGQRSRIGKAGVSARELRPSGSRGGPNEGPAPLFIGVLASGPAGVRDPAGVRARMSRPGGPPDQWGRPARPGLARRGSPAWSGGGVPSMRCDNPPTQEDAITICRRGLAAQISEKLLGTNIKGFDQLNAVVAEIEMFFADNPMQAPPKIKPGKERAMGKEANAVDFAPQSKGKKIMASGAPSKKVEEKPPPTSLPQQQAKPLTPLEMARAVQQEKNRRKNMKRRLKKQAEQEEAAAAPAELTPLQKLQKLIDDLEEYIPSKPTWGVPLDIYIPWEEMERKTRLKSWLHQMLQRAQEGEKLPLPEELAIFYKEDEITIEKLEEMLKDFSCNMVSIPPPASLQSPAVTPPVTTYRRRNRGKGKGRGRGKKSSPSLSEKANSPDLGKTIVFRGEKPQPASEMEVRANSFIFDPSDEEEEEQQDIASRLSDRRATQPVPFVLSDEEEYGGWAIPNKPFNRKTPESAARPAPSRSGKEETAAPEEDCLGSLFEEKPDEQPAARRVNQFGQPIKALEDTVPPLDQIRARADRKIIQHMKRFPTNITIWDAIAWSKDLRAALVKILQEPEVYEADVTELQAQALEALVAELYLGEPLGEQATASKGKEKQNVDANQASQGQEEEELFTVNKDLLEAQRLSRLAESTTPGPSCPERREINYEANAIGEIINRSIFLPPAYMQLLFHREEQWVERLKTFIVTHYRNDSLEKGETPKPIIFYKGDPLPHGPLEDDFGWSHTTQTAPEPVQEMDDMPEHIKKLCQRQKIAQMQDPSRREYFHQLWHPKQLRGQPPLLCKRH
ncbi:hypothetical protein Taro_022219, partial [Colocasia esculenta]|nr:hypothetical protein [Colocasia esculenta]